MSALEIFRKFGIDFVSATEAVDTSLPSGELVFQIFSAITQFERTASFPVGNVGLQPGASTPASGVVSVPLGSESTV
jgi:hypothetical protein